MHVWPNELIVHATSQVTLKVISSYQVFTLQSKYAYISIDRSFFDENFDFYSRTKEQNTLTIQTHMVLRSAS